MRYGKINCICSQGFYFETAHRTISCIKCGKINNVLEFPIKSNDEVIDGIEKDSVEGVDYSLEEGKENGIDL